MVCEAGETGRLKILADQSPQSLSRLEQSVFNRFDFRAGMTRQLFVSPIFGVLQEEDFAVARLLLARPRRSGQAHAASLSAPRAAER